jgi:hypothetical protein
MESTHFRNSSAVPAGLGFCESLTRHYVPGYFHCVPEARHLPYAMPQFGSSAKCGIATCGTRCLNLVRVQGAASPLAVRDASIWFACKVRHRHLRYAMPQFGSSAKCGTDASAICRYVLPGSQSKETQPAQRASENSPARSAGNRGGKEPVPQGRLNRFGATVSASDAMRLQDRKG